MEEESTPLANIMIEIGIREGKSKMRKKFIEAMDEIEEEHPGILLKDAYPMLQKKLDESSIDSHEEL